MRGVWVVLGFWVFEAGGYYKGGEENILP